MALQHAYSLTNLLSGLAASAFTWSTGGTTNRTFVNDGNMDRKFSAGSNASGVNVIIDMGTARAIGVVAVLNSNVASFGSADLKVEGADDAGMSVNLVEAKQRSTLLTTSTLNPKCKDHVLQFPAVTKRYWRLTWQWSGTQNLSIGELWFGAPLTTLSRAVVYGHGEDEEWLTTRFRSSVGETRGHFIAGPIRTRNLPFEDLSESEKDELLTLYRATYGGAATFLWVDQYDSSALAVASPYSSESCILGKLEEPKFSWTEADYTRFNPNALIVRSLGREVGA